jgi:hypothetical protein
MAKQFQIGRDGSNDIVISDSTVSRFHGIIFFEGNGSVFFEDLNSSNGSFVNGNRIYGKVQLKTTDIVKVGKELLKWHDYQTFSSVNQASSPNSNEHLNQESHSNKGYEPNTNKGNSFNPPPRNNQAMSKYWPVLLVLLVIGVIGAILISKSGSSSKVEGHVSEVKTEDNKNVNTPEPPVDNGPDLSVDTDQDGVADVNDQCPNKKGPSENGGCPYPDNDGDGTPDKDDDCKYNSGPKSNNGCPYEEESYRTKCPYCNFVSYETESDRYWTCGSCGERFYNCYKSSAGDHGGVRIEWFYDGDCDCLSCDDE